MIISTRRLIWLPVLGWAFSSAVLFLLSRLPFSSLLFASVYELLGIQTGSLLVMMSILLLPGISFTGMSLIGILDRWRWRDVALVGVMTLIIPLVPNAVIPHDGNYHQMLYVVYGSAFASGLIFCALVAYRQRRAVWLSACLPLGLIWGVGAYFALPYMSYGGNPLELIPVQAVVGLATGVLLMGANFYINRPGVEPAAKNKHEDDQSLDGLITSDGELVEPVVLPPARPVEKRKRGASQPERQWLPIFVALFLGAFVSVVMVNIYDRNVPGYRPTPTMEPPRIVPAPETTAQPERTILEIVSDALVPLDSMTEECRQLIASTEPKFVYPYSVNGTNASIALYPGDYSAMSGIERNDVLRQTPCHLVQKTSDFDYTVINSVAERLFIITHAKGIRQKELIMVNMETMTAVPLIQADRISLSPDGSHLISLRYLGSTTRVSAISISGDVIRTLGTVDKRVIHESWSSDSIHFSLVYGAYKPDVTEVYIARVDQPDIQLLEMSNRSMLYGQPVGLRWSPDGNYYLATGLIQDGEGYYLGAYNASERRLHNTYVSPDYIMCTGWMVSEGDQLPLIWFYVTGSRPDGTITYSSWTIRPDGSDLTYRGQLASNSCNQPVSWLGM